MNKIKHLQRASIGIFVLFLFLGCDDFLGVSPDARTELNTPQKISELLTGGYDYYHRVTPGVGVDYTDALEIASDNVTDLRKQVAPSKTQDNIYLWKDDNINDGLAFLFNNLYKSVSVSNEALLAIKELGGGDNLNHQKGEALLLRAFSHFILVNIFGKAYNPSTSNTDLGVPYLTSPEDRALPNYKRETVKQVYDNVEKDLKEGIKLVGVDSDYSDPAFHFTKKSAYAFATRFYLYKGEWKKVVKYASEILNDGVSRYIRDLNKSDYNGYWIEAVRLYFSDKETANLLIVKDRRQPGTLNQTYREGWSIMEMLFRNKRLYTQPLKKAWAYSIMPGGTDPNAEYIIKTGEHISALFSGEEVLLNRAEAYTMLGQNAKAMDDINTFMPFKTKEYDPNTDKLTEDMLKNIFYYDVVVTPQTYTPFYTITPEQLPLIHTIAELRRREFIWEGGSRWFDIKRYHMSIVHKTTDGTSHILQKDDPRKAFQIPSRAISLGLKANPR